MQYWTSRYFCVAHLHCILPVVVTSHCPCIAILFYVQIRVLNFVCVRVERRSPCSQTLMPSELRSPVQQRRVGLFLFLVFLERFGAIDASRYIEMRDVISDSRRGEYAILVLVSNKHWRAM